MTRAAVGIALLSALCLTSSARLRTQVPDGVAAAIKKLDAATADVIPALVVAVTDRNRTLGVIAHGYADIKTKTPATRDTPFEIGSIGKSFTAMALMQLMDEGRFDPQAPLSKYLPWFAVHSSPAPITGHHLLTHTAGLPRYRADLASTEFAAYALRDYDVPYAPGSHYWYSNLGYQTLGYALEHIEGAPWHTIIERRIFNRAAMTASAAIISDSLRTRLPVSYLTWPYGDALVEQTWFEYNAGDGSIVSTGADMALYMRIILNRGAVPDGRLVSERAFAMMTTPLLEDYAYGLSVRSVDGDTVIRHAGGIAGFSSVMEMHMNDGYGVTLMTNGRPPRELALWMFDAMKAAVRHRPLPDVPTRFAAPPHVSLDEGDAVVPPQFSAFVGRYKNHNSEDMAVRIFVRKGQLFAAHDFGAGEPLVALDDALFKPATPDFNPERYRFDTVVDGRALRLMFSGMPMYRVEDR